MFMEVYKLCLDCSQNVYSKLPKMIIQGSELFWPYYGGGWNTGGGVNACGV